mgnify:CR=1 FL=1
MCMRARWLRWMLMVWLRRLLLLGVMRRVVMGMVVMMTMLVLLMMVTVMMLMVMMMVVVMTTMVMMVVMMVVMVSFRISHRQGIRLAVQPARCQMPEPRVVNRPLGGFQLCGPLIKMSQLLRGAKISLVGNENIRRSHLIPELHIAEHLRFFEPSGVHQADYRAHGEYILVVLAGQGVQNLRGVTEPGRFNQQTVGLCLVNQLVEPYLHRQAGNAAHAAAGYFLDEGAFRLQHGAINAHLAELVHQYRPGFPFRLLAQKVQNGSGFANAKEPEYQVGGNRAGNAGHNSGLKNVIL